MRIKHLLNFFVATVFIGVAVGCAEKDLYDPNYGKEPVKGPEEYFGFETYLKNGIPNQKILLLILGIYFIVPPTISSNSFVIAC